MNVTIRRAVPGDQDVLAKLNAVVHDLHVAMFPEYFKATDANELANRFQSLLSEPTARIWLAEVGGTAVGYVVAVHQEAPEHALCHARRWCEIVEIAVASDWRNKGIGGTLVREVIAEAHGNGIYDIELTSWSFNEQAHQAFIHMGFTSKSVRFWIKGNSHSHAALPAHKSAE